MQQVKPYAQEDYAALVEAYDDNIATFRAFLNSRPTNEAEEIDFDNFEDIDTRLKVCKELPKVIEARNAIFLMATGQAADGPATTQPDTPQTAAQMLHESTPTAQ